MSFGKILKQNKIYFNGFGSGLLGKNIALKIDTLHPSQSHAKNIFLR